MTDGDNERSEFGETYGAPITGLLALLFAVLAGATAYPTVTSGSVSLVAFPVIFGLASLLCVRLRQRYVESTANIRSYSIPDRCSRTWCWRRSAMLIGVLVDLVVVRASCERVNR
jgi:hypothetical protein